METVLSNKEYINEWIRLFYIKRSKYFKYLSENIFRLNNDQKLVDKFLESYYVETSHQLKKYTNDSIINLCLIGIEEIKTQFEDLENGLRMILEINSTLDKNRTGIEISCEKLVDLAASINCTQDFYSYDLDDLYFDSTHGVYQAKQKLDNELLEHYRSIKFQREMCFGELNRPLQKIYDEEFLPFYSMQFGIEFIMVKAYMNAIEDYFKEEKNLLCEIKKELVSKEIKPYILDGKKIYKTYNIKLNNTHWIKNHKILPFVYEKRLASSYIMPFFTLSNGDILTSKKLFKGFWINLYIYEFFRTFSKLENYCKTRINVISKAYERDIIELIKNKYGILFSNYKFTIQNQSGEIDVGFVHKNILHLVEIKSFEKGFSNYQVKAFEKSKTLEWSKQIERYVNFANSGKCKEIMEKNHIKSFEIDLILRNPFMYYKSNDINGSINFKMFWEYDFFKQLD